MAVGIPDSQADLLASYYRAAAARMRQILLHPPGKKLSTQQWQQAYSAQKLQQIEKLLQDLDKTAAAELGKGFSKAISTGVRRANAQLAKAGVLSRQSPIMGNFGLIDSRQVQLLAADAAQTLQAATRSMRELGQTILRHTAQQNLGEAEINQILAGGVIDGMPVQARLELKKALERVHQHEVVDKKTGEVHKLDGFIQVNGRFYDSGYYSRMVYDTKTSEAHVKATHQRFAEEGIDLVQIIGNDTKWPCTEYLGQIYSLSGTHRIYKPLASLPGGGPPFHPNCSKSTIAYIEELN